jgi:hypothetical protein
MLCGVVRSPAYEAIHTRRIFFVSGEYWLIVDSLRGSVPHKYELRFHLSADAVNHCTQVTGPYSRGIRTPQFILLFESGLFPELAAKGHNCRGGPLWPPVPPSARVDEERAATEGRPYSCFLRHEFVSRVYGIKEAAPVVSVVSTGQPNVDFYTLIAPRDLSAPLPQFKVLSESYPLREGHVRIEGVGTNFNEADELTWRSDTDPMWRRISS